MAGEYRGGFDSVLHHGGARRMAMMGRGGDSMMAHMTPGEAVIPRGVMTPKLWSAFQEALDQQGMMPEQYVVGSGENSINPMTGQPEFLAQASAPGRAVRDYQRDFVEGPEGGSSGGGLLGRLNRAPVGVTGNVPGVTTSTSGGFPTSPEMGGGPARSSQQGMIAHAPMDQWAVDPDTGMFGTQGDPTNIGPALGGAIGSVLGGPLTGVGGYNLWEEYGPTIEVGGGFQEYGPGGPVQGNREFNIGPEGRDRTRQGFSRQRQMMEQSFVRPMEIPAPQFLGLSSAMSPLQMRTAIASRALAGQGGEYSSPEAATFYDNLLQRALIGDQGELFGLDTLLPIDLQYLAQIRGIQNPADTQSLLSALTQ